MRLTQTNFERSSTSERWHETARYVYEDDNAAEVGWRRVLEARELFKGFGCWQRLTGNVFTCITPDRLCKSVYVYA